MTLKVAQRKEKSLGLLIREADAVFSEYVRRKAMNNGRIKCFICGLSMTFAEAQCGHFISRDQMPTRYDEMNCRAICKTCNCFDPDHQQHFEEKLLTILTPEGMEHLWQKSRGLQKYSRFELGELIDEYKEKLKTLR